MPIMAPSLARLLAPALFATAGASSSAAGADNPGALLPPFLATPPVTGTGALETDAGAEDGPFTIIFVADAEARMRGNTDDEVSAYITSIAAHKTTREAYFDYAGGSYRIDPALVILGGDISADRATSPSADWPLWSQLPENGIPIIAGFGNHDWEQSSSYSFQGDESNRETTAFCRETYRNASGAEHFEYREFGPSDSRGPVTFAASFRGVQIVNFNTFLYQPSYHYDFTSVSGQECRDSNAVNGYAGCQVYTSAEPQIQALEAALHNNSATPTLFFQHYPLSTGDEWWDDYGASGTSLVQRKQRLRDLIGRYGSSALLSGHNHAFSMNSHMPSSGNEFMEYVAPYFGGSGGVNTGIGGGFLAILVSVTHGILEVKHVATPLAHEIVNLPTTTITTGSTIAATTTVYIDLSILPPNVNMLRACIQSSCFWQVYTCGMNSECSQISTPLLSQSTSDEETASILWMMLGMESSNTAVRGLLQCADAQCGSHILSATSASTTGGTTSSASSTSTSTTSSSTSTTTVSSNSSASLPCIPSSEERCREVATQFGLELGGDGYTFSGPYSTKGCYAYAAGSYQGIAYYGTGGTQEQMETDLPMPMYRPVGYSTCSPTSTTASPSSSLTELATTSTFTISSTSGLVTSEPGLAPIPEPPLTTPGASAQCGRVLRWKLDRLRNSGIFPRTCG